MGVSGEVYYQHKKMNFTHDEPVTFPVYQLSFHDEQRYKTYLRLHKKYKRFSKAPPGIPENDDWRPLLEAYLARNKREKRIGVRQLGRNMRKPGFNDYIIC